MEQKGCRFVPHAQVIRAGQPWTNSSKDATAHNLKGDPFDNPGFNPILPPTSSTTMKMAKPEKLPFALSCSIHAFMTGWLLVLDHPYAVVTDKDGKFKIEKLPVGTHKFIVWQERVGYVNRNLEVEIKADKDTDLGAIKLKIEQLTKKP